MVWPKQYNDEMEAYTRKQKEKEKQEKWHKFYLKIAKMYSEWSKDPRLKVGAILVSNDFGKILSVGYNGWAKGEPDKPDSLEPGKSGAVHAEINCLIKMDNKNQYPHSYMYMTVNPCRCCCRAIVNFGTIGTLIYSDDYRDTSGLDILKKAGIKVIKIMNEQ